MKLLSKLITAPRYAYLWLKVRDLVADKKFEEALRRNKGQSLRKQKEI